MVLYLRAILTWLGFLFNTTAPPIQFIVRQCIFRIRKSGILAAQSGLQMLLSRLLSNYQEISPKKEIADFIAASTAHPVLAPVNDLNQSLPIQANQLQVQVNQHLAQGSCTSIDFRSPSTLPTEWDLKRFKPLIPQLCQRYKGRVLVRSGIETKPIPAKKKDFSETLVDGWESVVHPEGALYFHDATRHVFTDANLRSKRLLKAINHLAHQLLLQASDIIDDSTHLVIELQVKEDACNYYFVQHDKRLLFWLQDYDEPICIYERVKGVKSDTHISGCLLALLNQADLFTNNRDRPRGTVLVRRSHCFNVLVGRHHDREGCTVNYIRAMLPSSLRLPQN